MTEQEFENAYVEHFILLRKTAYHLTGNWHNAEDLLADSIAKAWKFRDTYRGESKLLSWLLAILHNTFHNSYKKTNAVKRGRGIVIVSLNEHVFNSEVELGDILASPPKTGISYEKCYALIEDALKSFSKNQRDILRLYLLEHKTYEEVTTALNIPMGTVKSRLHRAIKKLTRHFEVLERDGNGLFRPL